MCMIIETHNILGLSMASFEYDIGIKKQGLKPNKFIYFFQFQLLFWLPVFSASLVSFYIDVTFEWFEMVSKSASNIVYRIKPLKTENI